MSMRIRIKGFDDKKLKITAETNFYSNIAFLDPVPDAADQNECGSMLIPIRIHNTGFMVPGS
jgi:hypothetical protein